MIQSMTGYGQSTGEYQQKKIHIEIKSLNGKATDVRLRLPNNFKEKEITLRNLLLERLQRGKIDMTINYDSDSGGQDFNLNKKLFEKYFDEINDIKTKLGIDSGDIIQAIMRIPNVVTASEDKMSDEEWNAILEIIDGAIANFNDFRMIEGDAMYKDLVLRINNLSNLLESTDRFEEERMTKIKERIKKNLSQHFANDNIDQNRFEQELIYYLERLDITEEKVRLAQHCSYFIEVMDGSDSVKGKKLGFISQEMGREINTLGAKSQNSQLQQIVVGMKDELEKIKEQLANIV